MLKVTYDAEELSGFSITKNDRGDWKLEQNNYNYMFTGFNGENAITIHNTWMQNGSWEIVAVCFSIDNPLKIIKKSGRGPKTYDKAMIEIVEEATSDYAE